MIYKTKRVCVLNLEYNNFSKHCYGFTGRSLLGKYRWEVRNSDKLNFSLKALLLADEVAQPIECSI